MSLDPDVEADEDKVLGDYEGSMGYMSDDVSFFIFGIFAEERLT